MDGNRAVILLHDIHMSFTPEILYYAVFVKEIATLILYEISTLFSSNYKTSFTISH